MTLLSWERKQWRAQGSVQGLDGPALDAVYARNAAWLADKPLQMFASGNFYPAKVTHAGPSAAVDLSDSLGKGQLR
jgi:hypothetical protein